ncbi:Uncharacterized protein PECH_008949 [Penicillium ucsense]|uniref:J domain-containing protein n=1 Tax=Penicillium ucsense TaxID=2839758 RepID=A0A8J8VZ30_9EURO|nr:Uncharacterized protein PECM_008641 [Penicillium ucsense]KAF7733805.1 Uncharacterized protein PECH_008949 [Penicillium ucsense]
MNSSLEPDPYAVLGVSKDATTAEIRSAHRKRVLKCHPDKVQDEALRSAAQDEFQRVQQAYETLSDETRRMRYDQKAKLAELKREVLEKRRRAAESSPTSSPRASASANAREVREGRIFEERVPVDILVDEVWHFTEEPRSMSRKHEEYGQRTKTRTTDDKKKARTPTSVYDNLKDLRDMAKAKMADQAKQRDRERRRQASAKYEYYDSLAESDEDTDTSRPDPSSERVKRPVYRTRTSRDSYDVRDSPRDARESRTRSREYGQRRMGSYQDEDVAVPSSRYSSRKHDSLVHDAEEHIHRSKHEGPRGGRSPQRHRGYESAEPEMSSSRRMGRSSRRPESTSRHNSWEKLDSPRREREEFKVPKMPASASSPYKSSIRPSLFGARATTSAGFTRPKREGSSREEPTLEKMAREEIPVRSSRRYDSGYSSPSTPEMPARGASPKATARYKILDPTTTEPPKSSKYRANSPVRIVPKRANTFNTVEKESPRVEVRRPRPGRTYDDEYPVRTRPQETKYPREVRPSEAYMSPGRSHYYSEARNPPIGRRQSTAA